MEQITTDMIMELHKVNDALKSKVDQAKGKLTLIEEQISTQVDTLAKYGVTPDTAQARIDELNDKSQTIYMEVKKLQEEIKNDGI